MAALVSSALISGACFVEPASANENLCDGKVVTLRGTAGDDDLVGGEGPDVIDAGSGNDTVDGLGGDDVVCAGDGDDFVSAGDGHDRIFGDGGVDEIDGGAGVDGIDGGNEGDVLRGGDGADSIVGGNGDDILFGGDGPDTLLGENGTDLVRSDAGDDTASGGNGPDDLDGGLGVDLVDGGLGPDVCANGETVVGCETNTTAPNSPSPTAHRCFGVVAAIVGTDGSDQLVGTAGNDVIVGLGGNDRIDGAGGNDRICGGDGIDELIGGNGADAIHGDGGDDRIDTGNHDDFADGGGGNDTIAGSTGNDTLDGGDGNDAISGWNGDDRVHGDAGDDVIDGGNGTDELFGDDGVDSIDGGNSVDTCVDGETLARCEDDGHTDTDVDGVVDLIEQRWGTSPALADSDADGLTDYFEIAYGGMPHLPFDADSNDVAPGDADEDADADDLTALVEQSLGTDPLNDDTDDDTSTDGAEVANGTDPLVPDQPVRTTVASNGSISVALTGPGNLSSTVTISTSTDPTYTGAPGQVGDAVDIDLDAFGAANLTAATITWTYDEAEITGDESDLRVFTWDEERLIWAPAGDTLDQQVDPSTNSVSATVAHFSKFALFDISDWFAFWATPADCSDTGQGGGPIEVALVIDSSGSMTSNDPQGLRRSAAKRFVDLLRVDAIEPSERDRAAVIDFDSRAAVLQSLTSDQAALKRAIDRIDASGGTSLTAGISTALGHMQTFGRADTTQTIVFLTDGVGSYSTSFTSLAASRGVIIFTIGLGSGVDRNVLEGIASGTGGRYFPASSASELEDVFLEIGGEVTSADQDGDGLTNCEEQEGMRAGNGRTYYSDPTIPDTDGDLLPDGIEIGQMQVSLDGNQVVEYYPVIADPQDANSDPDPNPVDTAPDDAFEFSEGSLPLVVDSDRERNGNGSLYLDDGLEYIMGTDPAQLDTDGDGLSDFYEQIGIDNEDPELAILLDLDPLAPDLAQTPDDWFGQYVDGYTCGDAFNLCPWLNDANLGTAPYIIGAIASGFAGPVPDARDLIGNLSRGDVFGTGTSLIAFVPMFGDSAAGISRAVKMLKRALSEPLSRKQATKVLQVIEQSDLPGGVADDIIDGVLGAARKTLKEAGITDEGLETLRITGGVDLDALADIVKNASPSTIPSPGFLNSWRRGEEILRQSGPDFIEKGKGFADPAVAGGRANYRIADAWDPVNQVALESKVGAQRLTDTLRRQIDRDAALQAAGQYNSVQWHFFASNLSGRIADDPALFDYLKSKGIPYVIHLP